MFRSLKAITTSYDRLYPAEEDEKKVGDINSPLKFPVSAFHGPFFTCVVILGDGGQLWPYVPQRGHTTQQREAPL